MSIDASKREQSVEKIEKDLIATKTDMIQLKADIRASLAEMKSAFEALRADFHDMRADTKTHLEESRTNVEMARADLHKEVSSLTKYAVVLAVSVVGVLSFILKVGSPIPMASTDSGTAHVNGQPVQHYDAQPPRQLQPTPEKPPDPQRK